MSDIIKSVQFRLPLDDNIDLSQLACAFAPSVKIVMVDIDDSTDRGLYKLSWPEDNGSDQHIQFLCHGKVRHTLMRHGESSSWIMLNHQARTYSGVLNLSDLGDTHVFGISKRYLYDSYLKHGMYFLDADICYVVERSRFNIVNDWNPLLWCLTDREFIDLLNTPDRLIEFYTLYRSRKLDFPDITLQAIYELCYDTVNSKRDLSYSDVRGALEATRPLVAAELNRMFAKLDHRLAQNTKSLRLIRSDKYIDQIKAAFAR